MSNPERMDRSYGSPLDVRSSVPGSDRSRESESVKEEAVVKVTDVAT
jgi:hypothetical protein